MAQSSIFSLRASATLLPTAAAAPHSWDRCLPSRHCGAAAPKAAQAVAVAVQQRDHGQIIEWRGCAIAAVEPPPPACAAAAAHQRSGSVPVPRRRRAPRSSWPATQARSSAGVSEKKHSRLRCTQAAKNKKQCDACSSRRPRGTREFPRCSSSLTSRGHARRGPAPASVLVATARVLCRVCFFAPSAHALECQRQ